VIKYHLAESPDVNETGEVWLREAVVPRARRYIDVGANVGDWLAGVVLRKGAEPFEAIAFEPSRSAADHLERRFGNDPRITIIRAAVGDVTENRSFVEEPDAGRGSSLVPGLGRLQGERRVVTVTTLDEEMRRAGWDEADVLKIDAEGFDARVLRGTLEMLRSRRIGIVQFEYNRAWQLAGETLYGIYTLLEGFGYRVFLLKRTGLYTLDYARYEEYFEYSNFVAIAPEWWPVVSSFFRGTI
jgi:FkbM family methyltransferase